MSCLCIGGVCIPYSAILPLLLVGLQWIAAKLARWGLLPDWMGKKLGVSSTGTITTHSSSASCCHSKNNPCYPTTESALTETTTLTDSEHETTEPPIAHITALSQWESLLDSSQKNNTALIVKFTADWCKPCRQIHPCYAELASKYGHARTACFVVVDVDGEDCDVISSRWRIAMMPTFLCVRGGVEVGRMSGGDSEEKLREWVGEMCR